MRPPVELGVHRAPASGVGIPPCTALRACRVPCQEQESPTCPPDRPSKILLVQVGTLSSSPIPRLGCLFSFFLRKKKTAARRGAGKRTAASGVAWSGCASLRGPLCAGEALLEARTQASVALFKLGAHSATLRPEFGGPKSLRCCCAKGVGHRAQLMLRARRGDRENNHPVPLLRTPTPQNALSLLSSLRGVTTTESLD